MESKLWFQVEGIELSPDPGADPFLLGSWLLCLAQGGSLHVHGSVSRRLLAGLSEWQDAWIRWLPKIYSHVTVTADEVREDSERSPLAVSAFSGGLDASYTVLRHLSEGDWRRVNLRAAMLVHGFDIPLRSDEAFANAHTRAAKMLAGSGLDLVVVRTNLKELGPHWTHMFGLGIASCFSLLAPHFGIGLIGSSEPYDALVLPWGSNPITDPMTSTGDVEIRHDGAGATRTEKAAFLASWDDGLPLLRVCWEGGMAEGNCGRCEKCVRTRLNFQASGLAEPSCIPPTDSRLPRVWLTNDATLAEWLSLRTHAKRSGQWAVAAKATWVIVRSRPLVVLHRHSGLLAIARRSKNVLIGRRTKR